MKKFLKNDFIKIISGINKNKFGKIKSIKINLVEIFDINILSKFFKIKFLNKIKYIYKNKNIPVDISNICFYNRIKYKINFIKKYDKNYRLIKNHGVFNEIV